MNKVMAQQQRQRGAAMLLFIIFFLMGTTALALGLARSMYSELYAVRLLQGSSQSYYAAETGVEDMAYRFISGKDYDTTEVVNVNGAIATTSYTYDGINDRYTIVSAGNKTALYRNSEIDLYVGSGASFAFGVQSGQGGFELTNGSSVLGNVFSNGTIIKTGGGTATINGDAVSASSTGLIKDAYVTGNAYARVIEDTTVLGNSLAHTLDGGHTYGDAYVFQKIGGAVVDGATLGYVPEQDYEALPITDAEIVTEELNIETNGTTILASDPLCSSGTYTINSDTVIGPVKIECNLDIQGNNTDVTLTGSIWVTGNITFTSGPNIAIDPTIGAKVVLFIADNPADRITSSKIDIGNSTSFAGSGSPKSYVLLISQNEDEENGTATETAINLGQSSSGDMLIYTGHGRVDIGNSVNLKEVTGYKIRLMNNTVVQYESGLASLIFHGVGGGYTIGDWREVP